MRRTELTKKTAQKKGLAALGAGTATMLLFWLWWAFAIVGVPVTGVLIYRWFKYRAEWGIRF